MSADAPIVSRPFHPKMCCDACVWKRGEHAIWCLVMPQFPIPADTSEPVCATFAQTYFIATDEQARTYRKMRRGPAVQPPTASPWEDPWVKRKE